MAEDITPKFFVPISASVPGGVSDISGTGDTSEIPSGTMVQPSKNDGNGSIKQGANTWQQGFGNDIFKISSLGIHLGAAEFADAPFSVSMAGDVVASSLTTTHLDIPNTTTANSFHVDTLGNAWWGATTFAGAVASVSKTGAAIFTSIALSGSVSISGIANSTATDISLLDLTHNVVFSVTDLDTVAWASGTITLSNGRTFAISSGNTGNMTLRTYVYLDTAVSSTVLQTTTTVATAMGANKKLICVAQNGNAEAQFQVNQGIGGMKLTAAMTSLSNNDWQYSGVWSVTDADTIAWGAGTLTTSNGGSYSITGSNTGNMTLKTYVYFDLAVSSTAFQTTTTSATAIGDGKILIAICQNATNEAKFIVVNDNSYNIDAANIVAGSITANEIAASTITAAKLSVSQLSAITADMGAITAGSIVMPSGGFIRAGQTAFDTGTGFYIGNDSGTPKFSFGSDTGGKITWDGTSLNVTGKIISITSAQIKTLAASPVELVAAPGSGKIVVIQQATFSYDHLGTTYGGGGGQVIITYNGSGVLANKLINDTAAIFFESADAIYQRTAVDTAIAIQGVNTNVTLKNNGAEYDTGNGTLKIYLKYSIMTL